MVLFSNEIKKDIFWVGAIDFNVRDFHGYTTPRGTTYNNFLIKDNKLCLVDTVKYDFCNEMLSRIGKIANLRDLKAVVINHIEPDHAGCVDKVMHIAKKAKIYTTKKGEEGLKGYFEKAKNWNFEIVKTGDELSIGKRTLRFIETPMLHFPESMVTYIPEEKLLMSQDIFGQHFANFELFDDFFDEGLLEDGVIDYYANILMPFGKLIKNKLEEIKSICKEGIEIIAPDHGVVWRKHAEKPLKMYADLASGKAELGVCIIYDSMWGSTESMARAVIEGILSEGLRVKQIKLRATPLSQAIKEFWKYRATLIGTPTLNNQAFTSVAAFLHALRGLRPSNRIVSAFGSYGWGKGGVKEAIESLKSMRLEVVEPGLEINYRPKSEGYKACFEFGKTFAAKVREYHKNF